MEQTNWKFILVIVILAIIVGGGILSYSKYSYEPISNVPLVQTFTTQEECEEKTGCECDVFLCDYKCPKDFKKGWGCVRKFSQQIINKCEEENQFIEEIKSDPECLAGEEFRCVDGWGVKWYYDKRLVSTTEFLSVFPSDAPEELKQATVAKYGNSSCACKNPTSYEILTEDKFEETTCEKFYKFIEDYNSSCNDCLLTWSFECC